MSLNKRGPLFRRVLGGSAAAFVGLWLLCAPMLREDAPQTVTSDVCKVGDGMTVSGFVVFSETTVGTGALVPAVADGRAVRRGQTVAWRCTAQTAEAAAEKQALTARIDALTAAPADDAAVKAALHQYAKHPTQAAAQTVRRALLSRAEGGNRLAETLRQQAAQIALPAVAATTSGCFAYKAASVLTPQALARVSPSEFSLLTEQTAPACRILLGQTWYFAALLPENRALSPAQRVCVSFPSGAAAEMTLVRRAESEAGCLIALSCDERLSEVAALGQTEARLTFAEYEGLNVPKAALRVRDGTTGVYVQIAGEARFRAVTLLYEEEDRFLAAEYPGDLTYLQPGDEILIDYYPET